MRNYHLRNRSRREAFDNGPLIYHNLHIMPVQHPCCSHGASTSQHISPPRPTAPVASSAHTRGRYNKRQGRDTRRGSAEYTTVPRRDTSRIDRSKQPRAAAAHAPGNLASRETCQMSRTSASSGAMSCLRRYPIDVQEVLFPLGLPTYLPIYLHTNQPATFFPLCSIINPHNPLASAQYRSCESKRHGYLDVQRAGCCRYATCRAATDQEKGGDGRGRETKCVPMKGGWRKMLEVQCRQECAHSTGRDGVRSCKLCEYAGRAWARLGLS
jgi:hypothetical protein